MTNVTDHVTPTTHPLVVLFFGDLFHLVEQLPDSELQLCEFLFRLDLTVVLCVFSDLDVQVDSLWREKHQ